MSSKFKIHPFNVKTAFPAEYAAWNRCINQIRSEYLPDDPPIPLNETINNLQSLQPFGIPTDRRFCART
jgi:hypothetical protein